MLGLDFGSKSSLFEVPLSFFRLYSLYLALEAFSLRPLLIYFGTSSSISSASSFFLFETTLADFTLLLDADRLLFYLLVVLDRDVRFLFEEVAPRE